MKVPSKLPGKKYIRIFGLIVIMAVSMWIGSKLGGVNPPPLSDKHVHSSEEPGKSTIWTCSMHPQIKMNKPGKCPICFMDLIPLTEGGNEEHKSSNTVRLSMSENAKILASIVTAPAIRRSVTSDLRMTGKIAFDETRVEMITARIAGRIDKLFVDYTGIPVKSGDHLAQIYSPELISLQQELLQAAKAVNNISPETSDMIRNSINRTFKAGKEKLRLLGFSDYELQQLLDRGTTSDHMIIRAGQSGIVFKKFVEEGAYVQTGTPLFHIADLRKLWVLLEAYESDIAWIRLGQLVEFSVEAFPGQTFTGTVSFIDPVINPQTRTSGVRVEVANSDLRLKPDMFVKARIKAALSRSGEVKNSSLRGKWISPMHPQIVKDHPGTCDICGMPLVRAEELGYVTSGFEDVDPLVVPATAPLYTGERSIVYVEVPGSDEPTYEAREVALGPRVNDYYIIKSGISEGEKVVVNGAFKIDGELQIRGKPSMMSPEGGATQTGHEGHTMNGMSHGNNTPAMQMVPPISDKPVSAEFTEKLHTLVDRYISAADGLADDNLQQVKKDLDAVKKAASEMNAYKGDQYQAWNSSRTALLGALEHVQHMAELADARTVFEKVSKQIITLEKHYLKSDGINHYLAFCPMAFNNNGAYWIQKSDSIRNPYFGAKMLKCGEIKDKL